LVPADGEITGKFSRRPALIPEKINTLRADSCTTAGKVVSLLSAWQGIGREMRGKDDIIDKVACF
jgi:hypothetical protein